MTYTLRYKDFGKTCYEIIEARDIFEAETKAREFCALWFIFAAILTTKSGKTLIL